MKAAIAWMTGNTVAANLLMLLIIVGGLVGMTRTKQEVFPEFALDAISVAVAYRGAGPEEVEQGIVLAVEEAVQGLDGVKRVNSTSAEGLGTVAIELLLDADPDQVLADVKTAVDRIRTFPAEAEEPQVSLASSRRRVISVVITGPEDPQTLHALAERVRADLLATGDITQVDVSGLPPLEIAIELEREKLQSYGLGFDDVARAVAGASLELPGGAIDSDGGEILVRVADRAKTGAQFENIVLRANRDGSVLRVADVAHVKDGFEEADLSTWYGGKRAVEITAYRVGDETPDSVATAAKAYVAQLEKELPDSVTLALWSDDSRLLQARMDLLIRNARLGLFLVVLILAIFLDIRLAFWVSLGIPISFMGTLMVMPALGVSINMITLFAFIVTLGLVVDDAIVVGEAAYAHHEAGKPRLQAAMDGAREMSMPVTFAILTSIAAFAPLLFVPGVMGKIFKFIPTIVIAVLVFSLIESFFVLPAHLGHGDESHDYEDPKTKRGPLGWAARLNAAVSARLSRFTNERYAPFLRKAFRRPGLVIAVAVGSLILTIGLVVSGVVPANFFPIIEADVVTASARLPYGSPIERTEALRAELERAAAAALTEMGAEDKLVGQLSQVGQGPPRGFGPGESGSHLVTIQLELVPAEEREFGARQFGAAWRRNMAEFPGLEALSIGSSGGPGAGADVAYQLSHSDTDVLAAASAEILEALRSYEQLTNVDSTFTAGKTQLDFHLLPEANTLGVTGRQVANELRGAFLGAEALREQRGRNEMRVVVRLPEDQRKSEHDLEQLRVLTPAGVHVPLSTVARFERGRAPTSIDREEGRRVVGVSAELAPGVETPREVRESMETEVLPALRSKYGGLVLATAGAQREQMESMAALGKNYLLALFVIFALLAVPFRSYVQPIIVMSAIPFGIVGAVFGHLVTGYELSLMSAFGIIALSGVVVNDSLVLVDAANRARDEGNPPEEAIVLGGVRRLRPILLTSLTTFFGLAPMILETSMQARFLIPMAVSLGFGVLFVTLIVLVLVPVLYTRVEAVRAWIAAGARPRGERDGDGDGDRGDDHGRGWRPLSEDGAVPAG